jgi:Flp pilus assembly protein TadB
MVSCVHRNIQSLSVHIVIACWLYVIAMVALTMKNGVAGAAMFCVVGCAPVALWWLLALRRMRRRRDAAEGMRSGLEREVHAGDDRDS